MIPKVRAEALIRKLEEIVNDPSLDRQQIDEVCRIALEQTIREAECEARNSTIIELAQGAQMIADTNQCQHGTEAWVYRIIADWIRQHLPKKASR